MKTRPRSSPDCGTRAPAVAHGAQLVLGRLAEAAKRHPSVGEEHLAHHALALEHARADGGAPLAVAVSSPVSSPSPKLPSSVKSDVPSCMARRRAARRAFTSLANSA